MKKAGSPAAVRHRGPDGREHYYSSKPPLFPTLLAGEYWLIRQSTGLTLAENPFQVMRWMLVVTNVLPLVLYFFVLLRCVERVAVTSAASCYAMAAATWGTFLTTFSVTINNHLPAAIAVLLASAWAFRIWVGETPLGFRISASCCRGAARTTFTTAIPRCG